MSVGINNNKLVRLDGFLATLRDAQFDPANYILDKDLNLYSNTLFRRVVVWLTSWVSDRYDPVQVAEKIAMVVNQNPPRADLTLIHNLVKWDARLVEQKPKAKQEIDQAFQKIILQNPRLTRDPWTRTKDIVRRVFNGALLAGGACLAVYLSYKTRELYNQIPIADPCSYGSAEIQPGKFQNLCNADSWKEWASNRFNSSEWMQKSGKFALAWGVGSMVVPKATKVDILAKSTPLFFPFPPLALPKELSVQGIIPVALSFMQLSALFALKSYDNSDQLFSLLMGAAAVNGFAKGLQSSPSLNALLPIFELGTIGYLARNNFADVAKAFRTEQLLGFKNHFHLLLLGNLAMYGASGTSLIQQGAGAIFGSSWMKDKVYSLIDLGIGGYLGRTIWQEGFGNTVGKALSSLMVIQPLMTSLQLLGGSFQGLMYLAGLSHPQRLPIPPAPPGQILPPRQRPQVVVKN